MKAIETGKPVNGVIMGVFNTKINNYKWIIINSIPQFHIGETKPFRVFSTFEDITVIRNTKEKLSHSLKEKEILLKEIHHRVKNNLQIISSLITLQTENINDAKTKAILETAKNRIQSISIIHKHLYESDDLSQIDFKKYLKTIITIFNSSLTENRIKTEVSGENILLDINTAVPASLIIHELVANSIKHAFKPKGNGKISVKVKNKNTIAEIVVKDDGKGLPKNFNINKTTSLGMNLVLNLVNQLRGTLEIENKNGTTFKVKFPITE
jgi:two-component sensor histidine kinase